MIKLPFPIDVETKPILKLVSRANEGLGELRGVLNLLPDEKLMLRILSISESKDSSAIENVITTYDELLKEEVLQIKESISAKEVLYYKSAIEYGQKELIERGVISLKLLTGIQKIVEQNTAGIRKMPGTVILNQSTNEVVYTPPQSEQEILDLLENLLEFIHNENQLDPLIVLGMIHYQFESIHPFYDGNGRTGRILNMLYLVFRKKLQFPILYLSKYILKHKDSYYELLKRCNQDISNITEFIEFMLLAIEKTAKDTVRMILNINQMIELSHEQMKQRLGKIYDPRIVIHLFSYLYTKNEYFRTDLGLSRATATKYLKLLEIEGFVHSEKVGKEVIYKNVQLFNIFTSE